MAPVERITDVVLLNFVTNAALQNFYFIAQTIYFYSKKKEQNFYISVNTIFTET